MLYNPHVYDISASLYDRPEEPRVTYPVGEKERLCTASFTVVPTAPEGLFVSLILRAIWIEQGIVHLQAITPGT